MNKIPTLFVRDPDDRAHVTERVTPGCEWVLAGEGVATRKYDGTCVMLDPDGAWWARREVKSGKQPPAGWTEVEHDEVTGKRMGWEPIGQRSFARFQAEALGTDHDARPGTYELVGPKINGNPEQRTRHELARHEDAEVLTGVPLTFDGLKEFLGEANGTMEGVVWHHPDGRMVKLKVRDFAAGP